MEGRFIGHTISDVTNDPQPLSIKRNLEVQEVYMKHWKPVIGVILIFVLGVLVGLIPGFYVRHRFPLPPPPPFAHGNRNNPMINRLSHDLNLTDPQRTQVEQIMESTRKKLYQHFLSMQPELKRIMGEEFAEIEKVLDENQKKKYRDMKQRLETDMKQLPPR